MKREVGLKFRFKNKKPGEKGATCKISLNDTVNPGERMVNVRGRNLDAQNWDKKKRERL